MMRSKVPSLVAAAAGVLLLLLAFGLGRLTARTPGQSGAVGAPSPTPVAAPPVGPQATTAVYAHNLLLRKGSHFRIYVRWIRGELARTRPVVNPTFDDPQSFVLQIDKGVISVHLQDLTDFLNEGRGTGSPLGNISLQSSGNTLEMHGTVHKLIPLPVKVSGTLSPLPDGRIQFHVLGISMLKMPVKGLLGMFHLKLADLVASAKTPGVEIDGNDVRFDTQTLLPPPHIHGQITGVVVSPTELKIIYGGAGDNEDRLSQWHNFLRFSGGTLDFGKLTMHNVDLTMIDASKDPWFDLDLVNYQAQLVNGYTRMTAQAGLEIYMPDLDEVTAAKKVGKGITLDWLKNRTSTLPSDVPFRDGKPVAP